MKKPQEVIPKWKKYFKKLLNERTKELIKQMNLGDDGLIKEPPSIEEIKTVTFRQNNKQRSVSERVTRLLKPEGISV